MRRCWSRAHNSGSKLRCRPPPSQLAFTHFSALPLPMPSTKLLLQRRVAAGCCCLWAQRIASHCDTHCNALQRTATHCNALRHTATRCTALQHTATHCNMLHHTASHCNALHHTAPHCTMLHHIATHCNTLQQAVERVNASSVLPLPMPSIELLLQRVAVCCSVVVS